MRYVQQKFWQDKQHYKILESGYTIEDNLTVKDVLEYCINHRMMNSISFLIGEDSDTKTIYTNLLRQLNII